MLTKSPLILAHRCGARSSGTADNGHSAIQASILNGITNLETDVRTSRDGVPMLLHEASFRLNMWRKLKVAELTYAEVLQLLKSRDVDVVTLQDALKLYPQAMFYLDLKDWPSVASAVAVIEAANASSRVCVSSFSDARIASYRAHAVQRPSYGMGLAKMVRLLACCLLNLKLWRPDVEETDIVQLPWRFLPSKKVKARTVRICHDFGLAAHFWTVNDPLSLRVAVDVGADGIITDTPLVMRANIRRFQSNST